MFDLLLAGQMNLTPALIKAKLDTLLANAEAVAKRCALESQRSSLCVAPFGCSLAILKVYSHRIQSIAFGSALLMPKPMIEICDTAERITEEVNRIAAVLRPRS